MAAPKAAVVMYLERMFGGTFREIENVRTIGTTPGLAVGRNYERTSLTFVNLGTDPIYLRPNTAPSTTNGIRIGGGGGLLGVNIFQDSTLPAQEWFAVSTAANQSLYVLECVRDTATSE